MTESNAFILPVFIHSTALQQHFGVVMTNRKTRNSKRNLEEVLAVTVQEGPGKRAQPQAAKPTPRGGGLRCHINL